MYKKKPFFIVFEGVEGCGKSYQSKKLFKNLKKKKKSKQFLPENLEEHIVLNLLEILFLKIISINHKKINLINIQIHCYI